MIGLDTELSSTEDRNDFDESLDQNYISRNQKIIISLTKERESRLASTEMRFVGGTVENPRMDKQDMKYSGKT